MNYPTKQCLLLWWFFHYLLSFSFLLFWYWPLCPTQFQRCTNNEQFTQSIFLSFLQMSLDLGILFRVSFFPKPDLENIHKACFSYFSKCIQGFFSGCHSNKNWILKIWQSAPLLFIQISLDLGFLFRVSSEILHSKMDFISFFKCN